MTRPTPVGEQTLAAELRSSALLLGMLAIVVSFGTALGLLLELTH